MDPLTAVPGQNLVTERLLLGGWDDEATASLLALSTDPEVMRHFPALATEEQIHQLVRRQQADLDAGRPGLYAARVRETGVSIGFVGLSTPTFEAPFTPCVEIGWRLARHAWGHGYATEAARAALAHGFETLRLAEIVSFTAVVNTPSIAVMRRLGMHTDPAEEFDHPAVPQRHPLRRHVLYRLSAEQWRRSRRGRSTRD